MTKSICCKNTEKEIDKSNIWSDDLFERQKVANNFTKIIESIEQPYVLSINSRYGSGKTFFLKRWAEDLKQKGEHVIFFNAWNCDFIEKPLIPFLYNFILQLKEQNLIKYGIQEDLKNCKEVFCIAVKEIIEKYSGLNVDILNDHKNPDTLKLPTIRTLTDYQELENILDNFKKGLFEITSKLNGKNIYVFVDELERCRPTFAIELLEAIKHLFGVKGLVFVLGIDREQLKHTISNIYGCGMDGEGYLRRFIDLELELPQPDIKKFTKYLQKSFEIVNKDNHKGSWTCGYDMFDIFFNLFALIYPMQLRDVEQIYAKFNVITKMLDENTNKIMPILAILLVLKVKDKSLYNQFTLENLSYQNIEVFLEKNIFQKLSEYKVVNKKHLLEQFKVTCMIFSNEDYNKILEKMYEEYQDINNIPPKIKAKMETYKRVAESQNYYECFEVNYIEYLKNMISYIKSE